MPESRPALTPKPSPASNQTAAHLGLFVAAVIWASTFIGIKVVLAQLPPNTIAFLRFFLAALPLSAYLLRTRRLPGQRVRDRADWLRLAAGGLTGVALYNFLQNQGLRYAGATDAAILASLAPIFLTLLARITLKERISRAQSLGIVTALAGSVLVITGGSLSGFVFNPPRLFGDTLILLTGLAWAVYSILVKSLLTRYPAVTVLAWTTITGTLFLLPLSLAEMPVNFGAVTLSGWLNILYLGFFASALTYLIWNLALTRVSAVTAAAYIYLIPALTAAMAALYYGRPPGAATIAGGAVVLLGTWLAARR